MDIKGYDPHLVLREGNFLSATGKQLALSSVCNFPHAALLSGTRHSAKLLNSQQLRLLASGSGGFRPASSIRLLCES